MNELNAHVFSLEEKALRCLQLLVGGFASASWKQADLLYIPKSRCGFENGYGSDQGEDVRKGQKVY